MGYLFRHYVLKNRNYGKIGVTKASFFLREGPELLPISKKIDNADVVHHKTWNCYSTSFGHHRLVSYQARTHENMR